MNVIWQTVDARLTATIPMEASTVPVQVVLSYTIHSGAEVKKTWSRRKNEKKTCFRIHFEIYIIN